MDAVKWTTGFWADKHKLCRSVMIPIVRQGLANPRNAAVLGNFRLPARLDKPILAGEFHFGALDRGMFDTGLRKTADQKDRADKYAACVRGALPG